jgi:transposase-like protein
LKGFPEAIEAVYPATVVQTWIVHLIRHSLRYVPRREREQVARDLKPIYTAVDQDAAHAALEAFDERWGARFPVITHAWLTWTASGCHARALGSCEVACVRREMSIRFEQADLWATRV